MQQNRLFEIIYILLRQGRATAGELAQRLEVSRRTILRDIDALSQAGVPIYTEPGRGGGIAIMEHYVLDRAVISDEEQDQILLALQSLGAAGPLDSAGVLGKLRAIFAKDETDWIAVDLSRWGNASADAAKFDLLKNAVLHQHVLSFTYASSYGAITQRRVYPLRLVFKSKAWYLQAYCLKKRDYRTFKLNRMTGLAAGMDAFDRTGLTPPPMEDESAPPPVVAQLSLRFTHTMAYRVYDEFDVENIVVEPNGDLTVTVDLPHDNWLYGYLLSFGAGVRVLQPRCVARMLRQAAEGIKNLYPPQ